MKNRLYLSVRGKFIITISAIILWSLICTLIEIPWFRMLSEETHPVLAAFIITCLALLPGIMIVMVLCGIILDKPRRMPIDEACLEDITVLIAAYNEEDGIYDTLMSLSRQQYPEKMLIKVIDNNSTDNTRAEISRAGNDFPDLDIEYLFEPAQGKHAALNKGLSTTETRYMITIDADTWLSNDAILKLANLMALENRNKSIAAIAGSVFVRNSRAGLLAKMQEWDYFMSIASIKRCQGLFQSVLVAQGAFSIYDTEVVKQAGGWKDSIGEDIVLTWELLSKGYRTYYCDDAIAFTNAPLTMKSFVRQRTRWARGLVEGFRHFSFRECTNPYARFFVFTDLFLFAIDFGITFFFIPGLFLALAFRWFLIVGPMTLLLLPLTIAFFMVMISKEYRYVFRQSGLKIRKHYLSLLIFILTYSIILSPACLKGYVEELIGSRRKWK